MLKKKGVFKPTVVFRTNIFQHGTFSAEVIHGRWGGKGEAVSARCVCHNISKLAFIQGAILR